MKHIYNIQISPIDGYSNNGQMVQDTETKKLYISGEQVKQFYDRETKQPRYVSLNVALEVDAADIAYAGENIIYVTRNYLSADNESKCETYTIIIGKELPQTPPAKHKLQW